MFLYRHTTRQLPHPQVGSVNVLTAVFGLITSAKEDCNLRRLFVCLSVSNFAQKFQTALHDIFREGWQ